MSSEIKERTTKIAIKDLYSPATLLVLVGMWAGGLGGIKDDVSDIKTEISKMEKQILVWMNDAEKQAIADREEMIKNHAEVLVLFSKQNHVDDFLGKKYPTEYTPFRRDGHYQ